jgi:predicted deacylase
VVGVGRTVTPPARSRVHHHSVSPTGLPWSLRALTVESSAPGPRAAICANLHGDECIGVGVVHRLASELPDLLLRGSVRLYPSLNPEGLRAGVRRTPGDDGDLNRAFPGDVRGSGAERTAYALWHDLLSFEPELVLDLHADSSASIPYAILDRIVSPDPHKVRRLARLGRLARATGITVANDYQEAPYRRFGLDRSLSGALLNHGRIEAFTLELGPRRLLHPAAVTTGVAAVFGALTELGLVARPAPPHASLVGGGPWRRDSGPTPRRAGVLTPLHAPGTVVREGADLATIHDLGGALLERLVSPTRAVVLSLTERAWIAPGENVATLAIPDEA